MRCFATTMTAAVIALTVCSAGAAAATPRAGKYQGVTFQKDRRLASPRIALEVVRRHGKARVTGTEISYAMDCEDGSSIARTTYLSGGHVTRGGRFKITGASGGSHGADGQISVRVTMRGRFTSAGAAEGIFSARATLSESVVSPAIACNSGPVGFKVSR